MREKNRKFILFGIGIFIVGAIAIAIALQNKQNDDVPTKNPVSRFKTLKLQNLKVTKTEAEKFVKFLIDEVNPAHDRNKYMPQLMQTKLNWILNKHTNNELELLLEPAYFRNNKDTIMHAGYTQEGKPFIAIVVQVVLELMWFDYVDHDRISISETWKNFFAISLIHEAVHLEHDRAHFARQYTEEQIIDEEVRVHALVTTQVIRPLTQSGHPVPARVADVDAILRRCHDDWQRCQELRDYVKP
jgi:hypothetical protein